MELNFTSPVRYCSAVLSVYRRPSKVMAQGIHRYCHHVALPQSQRLAQLHLIHAQQETVTADNRKM
jgi:hypothetical protein